MNSHDIDDLDKALSRLPNSLQPQHDLWPGIAAKIRIRRPRALRRWNLGFAAAAAVFAAVTAIWGIHRTHNLDHMDATAIVTPAPGAIPQNTDPGMQYASVIAADNALPIAARDALANNLRLLNDEIQRTQAAVKKYPGDINLQALLLDLYQQEARLINDAQQAQIQTQTRTSI